MTRQTSVMHCRRCDCTKNTILTPPPISKCSAILRNFLRSLTQKKEVLTQISHHFTAISPVVSSLHFTALTDAFPLISVEIDGMRPKPTAIRAGRAIFETPVVPAVKQGTQFTRNARVTRTMPAAYSDGHYAALCMYPSERLEMGVVFRSTRPPSHIDVTVCLHSQQVQDDSLVITQSSQGLRLVSYDPSYQKCYVVKWAW